MAVHPEFPLDELRRLLEDGQRDCAHHEINNALQKFNYVVAQSYGTTASSDHNHLVAHALVGQASILRDQGIINEAGGAYKLYLAAYKLFHDIGDVQGMGSVALYLGACNEMEGRLSIAGGYYRLSYNLLKDNPSSNSICCRALLRLSTVFTKICAFNQATAFMNKAFALAESMSIPAEDYSFMLQKRALLTFVEGELSDQRLHRVRDDLSEAGGLLIPNSAPLRKTQFHSTSALLLFLENPSSAAGKYELSKAFEIARAHSFRHQITRLRRIESGLKSPHELSKVSKDRNSESHLTKLRHIENPDTPDFPKYFAVLSKAQPNGSVDLEILKSFPIRPPVTLVMMGGGIKVLSYVGAIKVLSRHFEFNGYAGSSGGAIMASLLSAGYSIEEIEEQVNNLDYSKFKDFVGAWKIISGKVYAIYKGEAFAKWMDSMLHEKMQNIARPLMQDLPTRTIIYASALHSNGAIPFDSAGSNSNFAVTDAVRASISFPGVFRPVKYGSVDLYDGGIMQNFPFNEIKRDEIHRTLLGLYLLHPKHRSFDGLLGWMKLIFTILWMRDEASVVDKNRSAIVKIDPSPINTFDFNLARHKKEFLYYSGKKGAYEYLRFNNIEFDQEDAQETEKAFEALRKRIMLEQQRKKGLIKVGSILIALSIILAQLL